MCRDDVWCWGGFGGKKSPPTPSAEAVVFRMNLLAAPVIPKPSLESLLSICYVDMENEQFIFFFFKKTFLFSSYRAEIVAGGLLVFGQA